MLSSNRGEGGLRDDSSVDLASASRETASQQVINKTTICELQEDNKVISRSQLRFVKTASCQTNLISSCDGVISLKGVEMHHDFGEVSKRAGKTLSLTGQRNKSLEETTAEWVKLVGKPLSEQHTVRCQRRGSIVRAGLRDLV